MGGSIRMVWALVRVPATSTPAFEQTGCNLVSNFGCLEMLAY